MPSLQQNREEFNSYIWDHSIDPFQMQFDDRRELSSEELALLCKVREIATNSDDDEAIKDLGSITRKNKKLMSLILQIIGLTRNKIIMDIRASSKSHELIVPSSYERLPHTSAWTLAGPYLIKRLRSVLSHIDPDHITIEQVFETLNQSTWPGYIRQERAKRSGHEAESRLATLFYNLEIPFEPEEKAENPLCRDAQIGGISFDIVVPSVDKPRLVVKATVHTANIGQYGESKDHLEIMEARNWIEQAYNENNAPTLLAFIDGVGFRSNSAGLDGVLSKSNEFCQFRTIWKAAVIALSLLNKPRTLALDDKDIERFTPFLHRWNYQKHVMRRDELTDVVGWEEAGEALIQGA